VTSSSTDSSLATGPFVSKSLLYDEPVIRGWVTHVASFLDSHFKSRFGV
jgi:hypothetical protein